MTEAELQELVSDCPVLYHMAEGGSWPSIAERGLLSTSALLDLYEIDGQERGNIEARRRPASVALNHSKYPNAVVRDQIPMDDTGLRRCLPPHITPTEWYRTLNSKVFFWLTKDRLLRLVNGKAYRGRVHDVIEIDTARLVDAYRERIWLCPMNSGCTKPMPHARDESTFQRVQTYPYSQWKTKRKRGERVVELAVDYAVPDLQDYIIKVVQMQGDKELNRLA